MIQRRPRAFPVTLRGYRAQQLIVQFGVGIWHMDESEQLVGDFSLRAFMQLGGCQRVMLGGLALLAVLRHWEPLMQGRYLSLLRGSKQ
jgi:hypothetical protein